MKFYSAGDVAKRLPYAALVANLRHAFRQDIEVPLRSMYQIGLEASSQATFGLMPAWQEGKALAVKLLTIFPDNAVRGLATIQAQIVLFDGKTGIATAVIDGTEVTRRRTAAASALAATYLARRDAEYLVVVGTGAQAPHQAHAHAAVLPIRRVGIWGRSQTKARSVMDVLRHTAESASVHVVEDLEAAVRKADVISCVTSAPEPVVRGAWLKPGAFVDLVGSHVPERRECDDEAVRRSRIYVDTLAGALAEAGDLLIPLRQGVIRAHDIVGDLYGLCRGTVAGRGAPEEVTLFKSVGSALEDLAAAQLVAADQT